jgi:flagellar hook protein FlgE
MIEGMYAAISGLQANQTMLDVTANNLANLNTVGYKDQTVQFADALSEIYRGAGAATASLGGTSPIEVGAGVQVAGVETDESAGTLQSTGNPLDVAIEGSGYLCVGEGAPPTAPNTSTVQFTRAGDLTTDAAGYITNQNGQYVMGYSATASGTGASTTYSPGTYPAYIQIPAGSENVAIGSDGEVTYTDENSSDGTYGDKVTAGYLAMSTFSNPQGLQALGNNNFISTGDSGTPQIGQPGTGGRGQTISDELEGSNVDLATEFTNMITAQRGYQANSQVITTADEMLQTLEQIQH